MHCVEAEGPPLADKVRRLITENLQIAKSKFDKWLTQGIYRPPHAHVRNKDVQYSQKLI